MSNKVNVVTKDVLFEPIKCDEWSSMIHCMTLVSVTLLYRLKYILSWEIFQRIFLLSCSLRDLHAANRYDHLLQQLNDEASRNPQMIPLLLNALREKEDSDYDGLQ